MIRQSPGVYKITVDNLLDIYYDQKLALNFVAALQKLFWRNLYGLHESRPTICPNIDL